MYFYYSGRITHVEIHRNSDRFNNDAFAMIRWGNSLPTGLVNYPNLDRFYHHWCEDEGVKRAMEQQQIH
jgi:hypothetical protein